VYVYLDAGGDAGGDAPDIYEEMRSRIESLERQLEEANTRDRENRRLLAAALERVPELEAPPATPQEAESGVQRPWWRRLLGR
jgi:DNA replication initiation complex subunit (GINS family)